MDIGSQIKLLREERRITGKDLALKIGLSQSQMSRLEKGQRRIDTEVLGRIATALDVSHAMFFDEEQSPTSDDPLTLKRERELGIAQDVVGLGRLLEARLGLGVPLVLVGMARQCQLAVGLLDLPRAGLTADAQDFVVVALIAHVSWARAGGESTTERRAGSPVRHSR